jgi:hypothetical protein
LRYKYGQKTVLVPISNILFFDINYEDFDINYETFNTNYETLTQIMENFRGFYINYETNAHFMKILIYLCNVRILRR